VWFRFVKLKICLATEAAKSTVLVPKDPDSGILVVCVSCYDMISRMVEGFHWKHR
jgi:hypothetical protein